MSLEAIHKSLDDIPEQYRDLYSERNGQFELSGITGVKTQADVDRLSVSLSKERNDHKDTKTKLQTWGELNHDEVMTSLDRIPELEAAAKEGGIDEEKMNELVEGRLKTRIAPTERENAQLKTENEGLKTTVGEYQTKETTRKVHDNVRSACIEAKVLDTAQEDVLYLSERVFEVREDDGEVVTRDNVGVTPGLRAQDWLTEMQGKKPHWWPASQGSGANGGKGAGFNLANNPWSKEGWNMTAQGQYLTANGKDKAVIAAKAAGSHFGSIVPPTK